MAKHPFVVEAVESRVFLDATALLNSRGVFVVKGTDADEGIDIVLSSDSTKSQANLGGVLLGEADADDVRAVSVNGGEGNDTISVAETITRKTQVKGGAGDDMLTSASNRAALFGGSGNDSHSLTGDKRGSADGGGGNDTITGGDGDDTVTGTTSDDTIFGGEGDDSLTGNGEDDSVEEDEPEFGFERSRHRHGFGGHGSSRGGASY